MDGFYLTRCHYIIIHCTCTCIVQMKGTVTFLAKNLGWRTYTYKHARNSSGRLAIMCYYLFYVSHSQKLISRCPGDGGSYNTPFTDQLPPQPPYSVC